MHLSGVLQMAHLIKEAYANMNNLQKLIPLSWEKVKKAE